MTHIVKKAITSHQRKYARKYGFKKWQKHFYLVKNRAGETIKSFNTKSDALKYSNKRYGV